MNFQDGHVEDVICAEAGDTQVSLNIKRAVASMFQVPRDFFLRVSNVLFLFFF